MTAHQKKEKWKGGGGEGSDLIATYTFSFSKTLESFCLPSMNNFSFDQVEVDLKHALRMADSKVQKGGHQHSVQKRNVTKSCKMKRSNSQMLLISSKNTNFRGFTWLILEELLRFANIPTV